MYTFTLIPINDLVYYTAKNNFLIQENIFLNKKSFLN